MQNHNYEFMNIGKDSLRCSVNINYLWLALQFDKSAVLWREATNVELALATLIKRQLILSYAHDELFFVNLN